MTSKESEEIEEKELVSRYRRSSDLETSAPSDAVRAAILAEGRRVAEHLAKQGSQHTFDRSRPAANDSRWKIPAFGTLGVALLAALLIAPRYWESSPVSKVATAQLAAPESAPPASPPSANTGSVAPGAPRESLEEVVVTGANRRRANDEAQSSAKATAAPQAPSSTNAQPAVSPEAAPPIASARSAGKAMYSTADRLTAGRSVLMETPLQSAAEAGDLTQAAALLDQGAATDARDVQGRTPLLLAVAQGRLEVVRLLLRRGANPNLADNSGKTPLQEATDSNREDIAALLRTAGAR